MKFTAFMSGPPGTHRETLLHLLDYHSLRVGPCLIHPVLHTMPSVVPHAKQGQLVIRRMNAYVQIQVNFS